MASDAARVGMVLGGVAVFVLLAGVGMVLLGSESGVEEADAPEATGRSAVVHATSTVGGEAADGAAGSAGARPDTGGSAATLAAPLEVVPASPEDDLPPTDPEPSPTEGLDPAVAGQAVAALGQAIGAGPTDDTGKTRAAPEAGEKKTGGKKKRSCATSQVTRKDGVVVIPRSVLDQYATAPAKAAELGSFWWARNQAGDKTGVRLGKLPCPGLLRAAGFRSGDLVLSVNGDRPTSVARAVAIYGTARSQGSADVVVRRGKKGKKKKVRLRYRFTD